MLSALDAALRHKGHTVETASNGLEAASKLANSAGLFQAVITDLKMPGMDGLELLNHVKRTAPIVPVIVLTAFGTVQTAVEAMKAGANDFLVKPFSHQALDEILSRHVNPNSAAVSGRLSMDSSDIITQNPAMIALLDQAVQAEKPKPTFWIQAKSGTEKKLQVE